MAYVLRSKLPIFWKCNKVIYKIHHLVKRTEVKTFSTEELHGEKERFLDWNTSVVNVDLEDDKCMTLSSGKLAKLADGCAVVSYKNTTVMATVVSKKSLQQNSSFVPLTVLYRQKAAALGRIPLNFLRREAGISENEILTSRMIDRSVRPLFPEKFNWETQIICNPLAIDGSNFPDVLAINAASAALAVSDVPWSGPVAAVRIGLIDGKVVTNPTKQDLKRSEANIVVAARDCKMLLMLDGSASNLNQNYVIHCLKHGVKECQRIIDGIQTLRVSIGKPKRTFEKKEFDSDLVSEIKLLSEVRLREIFQNHSHHKLSRDTEIFNLQNDVLGKIQEHNSANLETAKEIFVEICKSVFKDLIFETDIRCDGRSLKELRKIKCETNLYNPLHGSALFQRGQTQVLCTVALDSPNSALKTDKIQMLTSGIKEKNFFVHYEFPPFATKDTGRLGPVGRREIGHGALAEKALQSNIPLDFPFTIRLTSEVLESNGSSSMATVCGGSLALMDAGVPIGNPCAGVAMGLISKCNEQNEIIDYRILTDILGIEDYFGEMDFKIASTKTAVTALQLDVKNSGIPFKLIYEVLSQAKESILEILKIMGEACPAVREKSERKNNFPEMQTVKVPPHLRSKFLGPGGANIKKMEAMIGVEIMEENVGEFVVFAANSDAMKEANETIAELLKSLDEITLEFGAVYSVIITEIKESGCMVSLHPNMKPVYIHVSQLDIRKVTHASALGLEVGQEIKVKYFGRDPISGVMRLSRKVLMGPISEVAKSFNKSCEENEGSKNKTSDSRI